MKRILGALILIVILAVPAVFGPAWVFTVLAAVVVPVCMYELYRVSIAKDARILGWIGLVSSVPFIYELYRSHVSVSYYILCTTAVIIMLVSLFLYEKGRVRAQDIMFAIMGLIYPLAMIGFWVLIRAGIDGRFWMIFGLVCIFGADAGAYYVGKNLGRRHFVPRLSPKKTVEGLLGGVAAGIVLGYLCLLIYTRFIALDGTYPLWFILVLAGCIGILDLAGDLTASLFKREFKVKDLGNLIPGHGGMLDRMDGIILVAPLLYLVIKVVS
ncbi:MAG: phosphatidate cytidylyltransferase [Desulfomonilia bacterium]